MKWGKNTYREKGQREGRNQKVLKGYIERQLFLHKHREIVYKQKSINTIKGYLYGLYGREILCKVQM